MILRKCSSCGMAVREALTWTSWAWTNEDGVRVAYLQKLCLTCVATTVAPLYVACESPEMRCPNCGIDTSEDYSALYCTFIPKGLGKLHLEAPMCGACQLHVRAKALVGAKRLEDREYQVRGLDDAPHPSAAETLRALGLSGS